MSKLPKTPLGILSSLLKEASEEFSYHGCTDFSVENTISNRKFISDVLAEENPEDFIEFGLCISEDGKKIIIQDFMFMSYFSRVFKKLSGEQND
jgi:hypothetical protein